MSKKKVFALRLDEDIYAAVERWAADEFRSANGQLEWIISKALKDARRLEPPLGTDTNNNMDNIDK
jgi:hypothetical protein